MANQGPRLARPRGEDELRDLAAIQGWSFAVAPADAESWLGRAGHDNVRMLRRGRDVLGGLILVPMGQFFGRRSVPMVGIAGVAIAPDRRRAGLGATLCRETVRELHRGRVALSTLYPSTQKLYRTAGWEVAGGRTEHRIAAARIGVHEPRIAVRPLAERERPAVQALFRACASDRPGELDRGPYCWERIFAPRNQSPRAFAIDGRRGLEGYAILYQNAKDALRFELVASDLCAATPRATRGLLSLLASHKTLVDAVVWRGGPADPFAALIPEIGAEQRRQYPWMLRICHVPAALEARGYPAGVRAELELAIDDDVVARNAGRWVLSVEGGRGRVARGGRGRLALDVRALAPLYTGHLSAELLARIGWLSGPEPDRAAATAVFAGPAPAMTDMF